MKIELTNKKPAPVKLGDLEYGDVFYFHYGNGIQDLKGDMFYVVVNPAGVTYDKEGRVWLLDLARNRLCWNGPGDIVNKVEAVVEIRS